MRVLITSKTVLRGKCNVQMDKMGIEKKDKYGGRVGAKVNGVV